MANPYLTSNDLIASVKRKIAIPISQITFTNEDILAFANEETFIAQVPSVLLYHEEYFSDVFLTPMLSNVSIYEIPDRAIGMKLRGLFWADASNNLFEMTRVNAEDRAFYQRNIGSNQSIHKFFLQGNSVVLTPTVTDNPTGSIVFIYFLRPNQLVTNDRAAIVQSFSQIVTLDNTNLNDGDILTIGSINFTAITGTPGPNEFIIGASSIISATNLAVAINANGAYSASNGTPSTASITINFTQLPPISNVLNSLQLNPIPSILSSLSTGYIIPQNLGIIFDSIPSNITNGSLIDFLQTKVGHKIRDYDVTIPANAISSNTITFPITEVPADLIVGDYICSANECIIPGIPTDLHNALAERTSARILAAQGDTAGLQASNQKISEIEKSQGELLDQRVEGNPKKVITRKSLLNYGKIGTIRSF